MEFEAVARPRCFRANREKDVNFVTNVCYPNSHSICVSAVWKKFPKIARHTGSLLQRKRDGSHVWMLVLLSLWVSGPSLCSHCQGKMIVKNDLQANLFMQWLSDHSMQRKLSSFEEGKALMESVFRLLFIKSSLDAKRWDLQVCPKDLTLRVRTLCFPILSVAWKHLPMSYWEWPWGNRLWQCVWKCWLPSCGYPEEVTFN